MLHCAWYTEEKTDICSNVYLDTPNIFKTKEKMWNLALKCTLGHYLPTKGFSVAFLQLGHSDTTNT